MTHSGIGAERVARYAWIYRTARWAKTRGAVLRRDKGLCQLCKAEGRLKPGREVDHIIELTDSNIHDEEIVYELDNLRTACWQCHRKRHGQEQSTLSEFLTPVPRRRTDDSGAHSGTAGEAGAGNEAGQAGSKPV